MIIPSKFNGFHGGVRRCFGGGGGGGGGSAEVSTPSTPTVVAPPPPPYANMAVNTQQGYNTLAGMKGTPWGQSGSAYNELLNQGFTSGQIKDSASSMYGAPSDANWGAMVQNAGMTSPTGRPMAGSDQFFQPVYNTSYQNYARPATQFDVSTYGTQPVYSPARAWNDANSGSAAGGRQAVNNAISGYFQNNQNAPISETLDFMRNSGVNRTDIQSWGGVNNYGPQMSMPSMQTQAQQPFNPYSNNSGFNGQLMTAGYGGFGSPMGGLSPYATNPFSYQQQSYQPQMQMQNPYSYQQPSYQQQYNPYQMQSPFSFQQPMQQAQPVAPRSSGPSQAIVSRSSQMRGTPNVMRRAEGGIASLVDDVE